MRFIKQETYFPIIIGIHFLIWTVDLYFYHGGFVETSSDTLFFGQMTNVSWLNVHRILGEVFSSWVVTVFAFNFLMATRARWVENIFGGLDKMYMIHRRSGVIAVFLLLAHFLIVPRDLVEFNPGKPLGFYAFILILLGVLLAALPFFKKRIPYNKWLNVHRLMGFFYCMGVAHGLMVNSLIRELPLTRAYVFGMAFVGIGAWIYRAFLYRFFNERFSYVVDRISHWDGDIVQISLKPLGKELEFLAGQFAFFRFRDISKSEQHPFTITSSPEQKDLRITVKSLGDYTSMLNEKLQLGQEVEVEGPYGHFTSKYIREKDQLWIAGGIGITPFLSLAKSEIPAKIRLIWCVSSMERSEGLEELERIQDLNLNFSFEIWESSKKGHLSIEKLGLVDIDKKGFLICGPEKLKDALIKELKRMGVKSKSIHEEEFAFR